MNRKNTLQKLALTALVAAFTVGSASCTLVSSDTEKNMGLTVAEVAIAKDAKFQKGGEKESYAAVLNDVDGSISKQDLIIAYLNFAQSEYASYYSSASMESVLDMLMDSLVSSKIMVQYAVEYYLDNSENCTVNGYNTYKTQHKTDLTDKYPELLSLRYFLTDGGTDEVKYDQAVYTLNVGINSSISSDESQFIEEEKKSDAKVYGESRTTPTGVGELESDYYPDYIADYGIYTGYNTVSGCHFEDEKLDGSSQQSRLRAYNSFLAGLYANNMVGKDEQTKDFTNVEYYYVELCGQLEQSLINKLAKDLTDKAKTFVTDTFAQSEYEKELNRQKSKYDEDISAFQEAFEVESDSSFVLYSPEDGFGYVYNILIPFTEAQSRALKTYESGTDEYYTARASFLENVKAEDLRAGWFSEDEDKNYSYLGTDEKYYFFEDNTSDTTGKYAPIKNYLGKLPYAGTVDFDNKKVTADKISFDDFIEKFKTFVSDVSGADVTGSKTQSYVSDGNYQKTNGTYDYSQFFYYTGKVNLGSETADDYFDRESLSYKAQSAVNELMFAYSTDTGCFNKYLGYSSSWFENQYVAEFAYAADKLIEEGAGSFGVCATEYGWHLLYVTKTFNEGEIYNGYVAADKDKEGTFSNLWYNYKAGELSITAQKQADASYNNETCVTVYTDRYEDMY